ncbi:MAG: hypothetical protein VX745_04485 [Pseudomonadota bacterium]|nr:hypothetical protein [Pseudomonadota bacterium]
MHSSIIKQQKCYFDVGVHGYVPGQQMWNHVVKEAAHKTARTLKPQVNKQNPTAIQAYE